MFLWYPVLDLARAPRLTARKKGSGYENASASVEQNSIGYTQIIISQDFKRIGEGLLR